MNLGNIPSGVPGSVLPESLSHLRWSCILPCCPEAGGWTRSLCWGPPQNSSRETKRKVSLLSPFQRSNHKSALKIVNLAELTSFFVVVMAHAAVVSHLKVAVQFWYNRNCGCNDCAECDTNSVRHKRNLELEDVAPQMRGDLLWTLWSTPSGCEWCMWASVHPICRPSRLWTPATNGRGPRWLDLAWKHPCCWPTPPPLVCSGDTREGIYQ